MSGWLTPVYFINVDDDYDEALVDIINVDDDYDEGQGPSSAPVGATIKRSRMPSVQGQVPSSAPVGALIKRSRMPSVQGQGPSSAPIGAPIKRSRMPSVQGQGPNSAPVGARIKRLRMPSVQGQVPSSAPVGAPIKRSRMPSVQGQGPSSAPVGGPIKRSRMPSVQGQGPISALVGAPIKKSRMPSVQGQGPSSAPVGALIKRSRMPLVPVAAKNKKFMRIRNQSTSKSNSVRNIQIRKSQSKVTAAELTTPTSSEQYFRILAEKLRVALQQALLENQQLRSMYDTVKLENIALNDMMEETNSFMDIFQELVNYTNDDTAIDTIGIDTIDVSSDESIDVES